MNKKRVIVADDDDDDRMLVQSAFQENRIDLQVHFALDGTDLMEILNKDSIEKPIFILLDLNMPKKNGKEVLKEIKEDPALKKIPVIIFTTAKNESEIRKCYELGANTYIVKPDTQAELRKVIANLSAYWLDTATTAE